MTRISSFVIKIKMKSRKLTPLLVILMAVVILIATLNPAQDNLKTVKDLLALKPTPPDWTLAYDSYPQQFGQLRLPEGKGPFPVVVIVHGGCWSAPFDLQHISPLATEITRLGFATWSLEYRRLGDEGGGWPGTFEDVADGTDFLREIADDYSLDLDRIIVLGHSAGGHLALWLAARPHIPHNSILYRKNPLLLSGVVSLAGVGDLNLAAKTQICGDVVEKLMGGNASEVPERYAQGSPSQLLPFDIPQILIQGSEDTIVPLESVITYYQKAKDSGEDVRLVTIEDAGHFEVVLPQSTAWPEVRKAILDLMDESEAFILFDQIQNKFQLGIPSR